VTRQKEPPLLVSLCCIYQTLMVLILHLATASVSVTEAWPSRLPNSVPPSKPVQRHELDAITSKYNSAIAHGIAWTDCSFMALTAVHELGRVPTKREWDQMLALTHQVTRDETKPMTSTQDISVLLLCLTCNDSSVNRAPLRS
jgi:hypothetical protein